MARNYVGRLGTPLERFVRKVDASGDCWEWIAYKSPKGYGAFNTGTKIVQAHRFAYTEFVGEIPKGYYVCHRCDNPGCVNPDHLFVGTQKDNMQDCLSKNRRPIKITKDQREVIRQDNRTLKAIADEYGVCFQLISLIKKGLR